MYNFDKFDPLVSLADRHLLDSYKPKNNYTNPTWHKNLGAPQQPGEAFLWWISSLISSGAAPLDYTQPNTHCAPPEEGSYRRA